MSCAPLRQPGMLQDTLYFGMSSPEGPVSEAQWQAFVDAELTPRFPDGLTQWAAKGQWRGSQGLQKEESRVLVLLHAPGPDADAKLEALIEAYKARFKQESVLRVRQAVDARF